MQIAQHRPMPSRQEQPPIHWHTDSISPRPTTTMSNRIYQPLTFSIDDRLSEQHLTQLDLCSKNLKKIEKLPNNIHFNVVLLDHNDITKVEHLDILTHLIQLSISHNRLIDIRLISRLKTLQKLNLSHNSLDSIDALKNLQNLVMLNISSNNIQNISALNTCHSLQSIDASDNAIRQIEDLSHLTSLKYLNLHRNLIDTLISASRHWPKSIHTLVISDNEIKDLAEIYYISSLIDLNTLYIHDNPCLFIINDRPFDYRPYILNWCLSIQNLDGISITRKESLKAEWLLSQGKGRSFRPGEHYELIQYLIKVCGTDADERDDLHLSRIMFQQDLYNEENTPKPSDKNGIDLQQSLLVSESEFVKLSPSSSVERTPSPEHLQSNPITERSSTNRYSTYDDRPIKPLDQNMLQSKLNQYPVEDINTSRPRATTNPQRTSTHAAYNANRYSPKTTSNGPTASAVTRTKSDRNSTTRNYRDRFEQQNQAKKRPATLKTKQTTSNEHKHLTDDDELQLKSAPGNDLKKITTSIETIRTSVLQAYLDLHERFTKTTELQTSALAALWKMYETQNLTHQRESEKILEENRLLHQRLQKLESRLISKSHILHPPLRAHISKRDTKSFFLHWIPNPLNEHYPILGYRIYIDDILESSVDSGIFETIIDCIRDEGDYRIKLRTYDENGESEDSNIVVIRFRRQHQITTVHRTQSDDINETQSPREQIEDNQPILPLPTTPDNQTKTSEERISPVTPDDNPKPLQLSNSSPSHSDRTTNNDTTTKQSPLRAGIMSRLTKTPNRITRNVLLNALPINLTHSSIETMNTTEPEAKSVDHTITFQPELNTSNNHGHFLVQQLPITSNSMIILPSSSPTETSF